jgi:XTP/dITP diphosphohydrolase
MRQLIVGTTNEAKIKQIKGALSSLGIHVSGIEDRSLLSGIKEDGVTAQENARKKATTYAKVSGKIVLSMDNALFIDGLDPQQQPGINVRRINGRNDRPSDEELLEYYSALISKIAPKVNGHWEFAVCIANPEETFRETTIISHRTFVATASPIRIPGYPLESIQTDPESGRYVSDMNQDEQDIFWQRTIGKQLCSFIQSLEL